MTRSPSMPDVLRRAIDSRLVDVRVAVPARVEKWDAAKQAVDVKPVVRTIRTDVDGVATPEPLEVVRNVPVLFPGAGGFRVTFPVQVGDIVLLVFADSSLDKWKTLGGSDVDPIDPRSHALSDAVAIVGLHDLAHPLSDVPSSSMKLGKDGGSAQVEIKDDEIVLAGGSSSVAREGDEVDLGTWTFAGQGSISIVPPGGGTPVTLNPGVPAAVSGRIAEGAEKVKA